MRLLLISALSVSLAAQDRYQSTSANQPLCPKVIDDSEGVRPGGVPVETAPSLSRAGSFGARSTTVTTTAATTAGIPSAVDSTLAATNTPGKPVFYAPGQRKDISAFGVLDRSGKLITVGDLKGKVVVVGLWTIGCDPSLKQLGEMVDLQGKGDKFGFKVLPASVDPERWTRIAPWLQQNADRLSGATIYTPGLGEHGPSVISSNITGVPAVFITDREGRVACSLYGFEPKNLVNALKQVLSQNPPAKQ